MQKGRQVSRPFYEVCFPHTLVLIKIDLLASVDAVIDRSVDPCDCFFFIAVFNVMQKLVIIQVKVLNTVQHAETIPQGEYGRFEGMEHEWDQHIS